MDYYDLYAKIKEALATAKDNGYLFEDMSPGEVAYDLITYHPELEDAEFGEIACIIHSIRFMKC